MMRNKTMKKIIIKIIKILDKLKMLIVAFFVLAGVALLSFYNVTITESEPSFIPTLGDKTVFLLPTWHCENSIYEQDFEPTSENMAKHFGEGYPAYVCPDGIGGKMFKETDPAKKIKVTVKGPSYIENEIIEEEYNRKKAGEPKMSEFEKQQYRARRLQDIKREIERMRMLEDK